MGDILVPRRERHDDERDATSTLAGKTRRTLVIGYGNIDRGDDGVAFHLVNSLRRRMGQDQLEYDETGLEYLGREVDSIFLVQLTPEMMEVMKEYDRVIFVDAHVTAGSGQDIRFDRLPPIFRSNCFSHQMTPEALILFLKTIFGKELPAYILSIGGRDFDFGRQLSEATAVLVEKASASLMQLLESNSCGSITR
ncbi:MAG: hydrogenase maturation protease [Smithellaceae bacterium]|nr:hydrogenase maturation protease [Smithellaceae bacterium]